MTADDRLAEARDILFHLGLELHADSMMEQEQRIVNSLAKNLTHRNDGRPIQVSDIQLRKLRTLKEKYLS